MKIVVLSGLLFTWALLGTALAQSIKMYNPDTGEELDPNHLSNRIQFKVVNLSPPASNPNLPQSPSWGYLWTFGDCSYPSTQSEPIHIYKDENKTYDLKLVLTPKYADEDEELPEFLKTITVRHPFTAPETDESNYDFESGSSVDIVPIRACKPGDLNTFIVHYKNSDNFNYNSPQLKFRFNASHTSFDTSYMDGCGYGSYQHQTSGGGELGELIINLNALAPNEEGFTSISLLTNTSAPLGILLDFKAEFYDGQGGNLVSDKLITLEVKNSHDPNEKLVKGSGNCSLDSLIYTINFENEGTANAEMVYIIDHVDRHLDMQSIIFAGGSYSLNTSPIIDSISLNDSFNPHFLPVDTSVSALILRDTTRRKLAVVFNNIQLPPSQPIASVDGAPTKSGTGSYQYSIKPDSSQPGSSTGAFRSHAEIYFDDNPPIATNTAEIQPERCYCEPNQNNSQAYWIQHVKMAEINHQSGNDGGFANYRSYQTNATIGNYYSIQLSPGMVSPKTVYWHVYVDTDHNGNFDSYDLLVSTSGMMPATANLYIPTAAGRGKTTMRIIMSDASISSPCGSSIDGEVEDYSVYLMHPLLPDLTISNRSLNLYIPQPGSVLTATATVKNSGLDSVKTTTSLGFYLSADPYYDQSDQLLKQRALPMLGSQAEVTLTDSLILPGTVKGNYYIMIVADPMGSISENQEDNNSSFLRVKITDPLPDLQIKGARSCNRHFVAGESASIDFTVFNRGTRYAGGLNKPIEVKAFLSANTELETGDVFLDSIILDSILVDSIYSFSMNCDLPATVSTGKYFVLLHIDAARQVEESYESNNTAARVIFVTSNARVKAPFYASFECSQLSPWWNIDDSLNNRVGVKTDGSPYAGNQHLVLETATFGTLSWIDLRINTSSMQQSGFLEFAWKDIDTSHTDTMNGIYFSDNNGQSFYKVFDLNAQQASWNNTVLSLDSISNAHNSNIDSNLVIRILVNGVGSLPIGGIAIDELGIQPAMPTGSAPPINLSQTAIGEQHTLNIYPNPSNGSFSIRSESASKDQPQHLIIYDVYGRRVYHSTLASESEIIRLETQLSPGWYLVQLGRQGESNTARILITR